MNIFQELIVVAVFVLCQGDTKYFLMVMLQREVNQFSQFIPCPSSGFSANAISPVIISPKSLQSLKGHTTLNQIPSKQQLNWIITLKDYSISMLVQFLKSKYFPHANFLQTKGLNLFLQIHHSRQKSFFFFFSLYCVHNRIPTRTIIFSLSSSLPHNCPKCPLENHFSSPEGMLLVPISLASIPPPQLPNSYLFFSLSNIFSWCHSNIDKDQVQCPIALNPMVPI